MINKTSFKQKDFLILLFIIFIVVLVYINILDNPFIWDDEVIIESNRFIQDDVTIKEILTRGIWGNKLKANSFYRPINAISFAIDYKIWGLNPLGFHISSIFLFLISLIVLYFLLLRLGIQKIIVYFIVLGFGIHPLNTEVITYISGRADIFLLLFSLLSFLLFLKFLNTNLKNKKILYYFLSIIFFLLALFSKENAVILPFIIGTFLLLFKKEEIKAHLLHFSPFLFLSFLYVELRLFIIHSSNFVSLSTIANASLWERFLTLPKILIIYITKIIFPFNLHMEYLFVEQSPYFLLVFPIIFFIFYVLIKILKFSKKSLFFSLWFFIGLVPFFNIFPTLTATLREHWVIFPMIGFIVLLSLLFKKMFFKTNNKNIKIGLILFLISIFLYWGGLTIIRNNQWEDPFFLYQNDLKYEPNSFLLHNNLGVEYFRRGNYKKAKKHFLAAIEISPRSSYSPAYNNLGVIYRNEGQTEEAINCYKKSIALDDYLLAHQNIVELYIQDKNFQKAKTFLNQALNYYPQDQTLLNLEIVLNRQ